MNVVTYEGLFAVFSFLLAFAIAIVGAVKFILDLIDKYNKK